MGEGVFQPHEASILKHWIRKNNAPFADESAAFLCNETPTAVFVVQSSE